MVMSGNATLDYAKTLENRIALLERKGGDAGGDAATEHAARHAPYRQRRMGEEPMKRKAGWIIAAAAWLLSLALISELGAATTWRMPVQGNPGVGDLVYGKDKSNLTSLPSVAVGQMLISNGAGAPPVWSATPAGILATIVTAASGTTVLTAAQSGATVYNTGTSATTTFTLPVAVPGMQFCFVEAGNAAGELLINPAASGTTIIGKIHGAENATGISTASGVGIKNTAATNVTGDHTCLVALTTTLWAMRSVAGVWATQ
jgi:hypothetical protein